MPVIVMPIRFRVTGRQTHHDIPRRREFLGIRISYLDSARKRAVADRLERDGDSAAKRRTCFATAWRTVAP